MHESRTRQEFASVHDFLFIRWLPAICPLVLIILLSSADTRPPGPRFISRLDTVEFDITFLPSRVFACVGDKIDKKVKNDDTVVDHLRTCKRYQFNKPGI